MEYSNHLLRNFIEDQLVYFPNSTRVLPKWIVTSDEFFESVIVRNDIPITDIPPSLQVALNVSKEEEVIKLYSNEEKSSSSISYRDGEHSWSL